MCATLRSPQKITGFFLSSCLAVGEESRIPVFVAQLQPRKIVLGIRRVDRDHVELLEFRGDDAAFVPRVALELIGKRELLREAVGKAVDDLERLLLREDGGSRIAFLLGRVPVLVVVRQIDFRLAFLGLGFLQAQDVGLVLGDEFLKGALFHHGTNAVDVPAVEFHEREYKRANLNGRMGRMEITGGCLCRAVRFRITAEPIAMRLCWCRVCQYIAAGNATVNVVFPEQRRFHRGRAARLPKHCRQRQCHAPAFLSGLRHAHFQRSGSASAPDHRAQRRRWMTQGLPDPAPPSGQRRRRNGPGSMSPFRDTQASRRRWPERTDSGTRRE